MRAKGDIRIIEVTDSLPAGLSSLAEQARDEGHRHLDRLIADWTSGALRFERPGEALLAAHIADEFVGVGGLAVEPRLQSAFRMRRFYVLPSFRGQGIGGHLAQTLMRRAASAEALTVNAGDDDAGRFWEMLGFVRISGNGFTHILLPNHNGS